MSFNLLEHVMNLISIFKLADWVTGRGADGLLRIHHAFVPSIRVHEVCYKLINVTAAFARRGSCDSLV